MLAAVLGSLLSTLVPDEAVRRAEEVLAAARAAIGVTDARALSLRADLRRIAPAPDGAPGEMSGEVRVDALVPGRYRRSESLAPFPGAPPFTLVFGLDGEAAWTETPPAGGGGVVVIRMRPGTGLGGPGDEAALRRRLRAESARLFVATLLATDAAVPLEARHVALAEAPEGKADVIELTGADGFATRLFVDTVTHRPLMLTYRERRPRAVVRRMEGPLHPGTDGAPPAALPGEPPEEEATLHLEDYRRVGGVLLPHRLTVSFDGSPGEEWTVQEYKVNPPLEPRAFRKR